MAFDGDKQTSRSNHHYFLQIHSYVQPPPSRFQHNQDILTNSIPNDDDLHGSERYIAESVDRLKGNHKNGFYIDLPTMADYKRQKKWNSLIKTNYKLIKSKKYNVIAFKHKYHNVPYYIVSDRNCIVWKIS